MSKLIAIVVVWILSWEYTISSVINQSLKSAETTPQQVHIAFGDEPCRSMSVTWSTMSGRVETVVQYGEGEALTEEVYGNRRAFQDDGEEKRVQYIHRVLLRGLKPETHYVYRCGSSEGWSEQFRFRTAPEEGRGVTLAIYGDMGTTHANIQPVVQAEVTNGKLDAVIHVGDFAYDMKDDNGRVGDEFMRQIEGIAANVPYMVCPGNHENAYNFSQYRERFTMPGSSESLYYGFDLGPARFISINTEAYYYLNFGQDVLVNQYNWLLHQLKEANRGGNREKRPWLIVYGHKPMYCSNIWIDDCSLKTTKTRVGLPVDKWYQYGLEELFYENGVDLLFWGHEHSYERLWPVYDYSVKNGSSVEPNTDPRGPVHITTGAAGSKYLMTGFPKFKPQWSAYRSEDFGYTLLKVHNKTHIHVQQISINQGGQPVDDFWIIKNHHGPYQKLF